MGEGHIRRIYVGFQKRMFHRFTLQANYTFTHAIDTFEFNPHFRIQTAKALISWRSQTLRQFCRESASGYDGNGQTNADGRSSIPSAIQSEAGTFYTAHSTKVRRSLPQLHLSAPWYRALRGNSKSGIFARRAVFTTQGPADGV